MENSAKLRVTRGHELFGAARKLKLYIDGELAGFVPSNVTHEFQILPGRRTFFVKMDWYECQPKELNARAGAVYNYIVSYPTDVMGGIYFFFIVPKQFFRLTPTAKNTDEVY